MSKEKNISSVRVVELTLNQFIEQTTKHDCPIFLAHTEEENLTGVLISLERFNQAFTFGANKMTPLQAREAAIIISELDTIPAEANTEKKQ